MIRLYLLAGAVAAVLAVFGWTYLAGKSAGEDGAKVENLEGQLEERDKNDALINDAKRAGRDAAANGLPDDPNRRD